MKTTGGKAIMEILIAEGIDTIFGYPGGAIMPVYDALFGYESRIRHILVRHEQGAAHAAEGYARLSGKVGVCLANSGPGATNLVTGIADAQMDSVPLVCITGQVSSKYVGTDAFQEIDIVSITSPITKWNYQITTSDEIPFVFSKAFHIAQEGRPGPVLIDITKNAQFDTFDFFYPKKKNHKQKGKIPAKQMFADTAALLHDAKQPFIFAGHAVLIAHAEKELLEIAQLMNAPVACTLHGLSAITNPHPLYVGMLGMHGNYA